MRATFKLGLSCASVCHYAGPVQICGRSLRSCASSSTLKASRFVPKCGLLAQKSIFAKHAGFRDARKSIAPLLKALHAKRWRECSLCTCKGLSSRAIRFWTFWLASSPTLQYVTLTLMSSIPCVVAGPRIQYHFCVDYLRLPGVGNKSFHR